MYKKLKLSKEIGILSAYKILVIFMNLIYSQKIKFPFNTFDLYRNK